MVQCVQLYYRQQKHQKEIAKALGSSSSKVARLLKRAFADGLIRVETDLPKHPSLEAELTERFGLKDAVVIPTGDEQEIKEDLGAAAARYFEKVAANGDRAGLSWGFTRFPTPRQLK